MDTLIWRLRHLARRKMCHDLQNFTLAHILENIFLCYFRRFGIVIFRLPGRLVLELLPVQNGWGWLDSFANFQRVRG
jgi:hypothetical protein